MGQVYDVVVVGAGTAGQTAAYALNKSGLTVGLVEHSHQAGGVCALHGCQAKKWFYEGAETVARSRHLENIGIVTPAVASWPQLLRAKNQFTEKVPAATVNGLKSAGIDFIQGRARLLDGQTLDVGGRSISATYIVLATGAQPMHLPIEGIEAVIDSNAFLELQDLPRRIAFIGGGFISFEFAHFAVRLGPEGTRCTILEAGPRPLGPFDAEMVDLLTQASAQEGIDIHISVEITRIEKSGSTLTVSTKDKRQFEVDLVVHGAGRTPAIEDLDLAAAGIDFSRRGITVDRRMATTNPQVYAVGDCAATVQLARVADAEAKIAARTIAARHRGLPVEEGMDYSAVPAVLFTYPQYAMAGKTEQALQAEGISYKKSFASGLNWPTYRRVGLKSAAFKVLADNNGRILGAHILSDETAGLINTFALAMHNRISVSDLHHQCIMTPYPSRVSDIIYMLGPLAG